MSEDGVHAPDNVRKDKTVRRERATAIGIAALLKAGRKGASVSTATSTWKWTRTAAATGVSATAWTASRVGCDSALSTSLASPAG